MKDRDSSALGPNESPMTHSIDSVMNGEDERRVNEYLKRQESMPPFSAIALLEQAIGIFHESYPEVYFQEEASPMCGGENEQRSSIDQKYEASLIQLKRIIGDLRREIQEEAAKRKAQDRSLGYVYDLINSLLFHHKQNGGN